MTDELHYRFARRSVLIAASTSLVSLAGCVGGGSEPAAPEELAYSLTITRSGETPELEIDPDGPVADVIQINVGDSVEFTIVNEADVPVGFHNHANDAEIVIEAGGARSMSFEATEAMTGRQEIEGWIADENHDGTGTNGEHGPEATSLAIIEVRPRGS